MTASSRERESVCELLELYRLILSAGIFNLELSWRELDGSFHNKLNWAQIMADKGSITLSLVDCTLATRVPVGGADVEQGGGMDLSLRLQRDVYFHMDVFRVDQVIRNIITNAVSYYSLLLRYTC